MVAKTLGSYQILSQLGAGAMGEVYLAEHRHLKRKAAVKLLAPELCGRPDLLERFFLEARATSAIDHPGIVQIFDCEVDPNGRPYIVMEYLDGKTLSALIAERGPLPGIQAARLLRGMAEALEAAHAKGIVHRDLKPENIFVLSHPPDSVKLVDFGIAKLAGDFRAAQVHQTRSGAMMGTPLYMSPEQCRDSANLDFRTDLYSLGCVLFEMLTGRPPFTQDALGDLVVAHLTLAPPDARKLNPAVPPALAEMAAALLRKNPAERPASMREVANQAAAFIGSLTTVPDAQLARAAESRAVAAKAKTTFGDSAAELVTGGPRKTSRAGLAIGLAVAAVALAAGGLYASRLGSNPTGHSGAASTASSSAGSAPPAPAAALAAATTATTPPAAPPATPPAATAPAAAPIKNATEEQEKKPARAEMRERKGAHHAVEVAANPPVEPTEESGGRASYVGNWEGPWNDPTRHQNGRLFVQIGDGGSVAGWMSNLTSRQSFRMSGRMLGPGDLALACQCPPRQEFGARVVLHPAGSAELKGQIALSAGTGVFGQSHVLLHRGAGGR